jgi:hypothetical protein
MRHRLRRLKAPILECVPSQKKEDRAMSRSSTTTAGDERLRNPHVGEILAEEFLKPLGMSQSALARAIGVPPRRINEIILGKRAVTADRAFSCACKPPAISKSRSERWETCLPGSHLGRPRCNPASTQLFPSARNQRKA